MALAEPTVAHLDTRFFFPFSIDVETVRTAHPGIRSGNRSWLDGVDELITAGPDPKRNDSVVRHLGPWRHNTYDRHDPESKTYQNILAFHPFVRRVFFDMTRDRLRPHTDNLLRVYAIEIPAESRLVYRAEDLDGTSEEVAVGDLSLLLFANGIGILAMGIQAFGLSAGRALWINEMMRKVYPSSARQVREVRVPVRAALVLVRDGLRTTIVEHDFRTGALVNLLPPLTRTLTALLYFLDYDREEYEPVLDERMVVYSYICLDPESLPPGFAASDEYQVLLSQFLYVDRAGDGFRYNPEFIKEAMKAQVYTRWSHLGTHYGFTSYSSIAITIGGGGCDAARPREGLVVHRMFDTRYRIIALIALFYRATLLDYSERVALVSKRIYLDQWLGRLQMENLRLIAQIRAEFLHFNAHWYFDELTNKDEESDHFRLHCLQYRTEVMRRDIESELHAMSMSLHDAYQLRATEAVNRLAIISALLGCGAVVTGFFGMNFGHMFDFMLKPEPGLEWIYWVAISFPVLVAVGVLGFGAWMVIANWPDFRTALVPRRLYRETAASERFRRKAGDPEM